MLRGKFPISVQIMNRTHLHIDFNWGRKFELVLMSSRHALQYMPKHVSLMVSLKFLVWYLRPIAAETPQENKTDENWYLEFSSLMDGRSFLKTKDSSLL